MNSNGEDKLASLAKEFFSKVEGDDGLQELFKGFQQHQIDHHPKTFHSHAFGEGAYTQEEIEAAHKNVEIGDQHFDSMIDHFVQTLDSHGYGEGDKTKAIAKLQEYKKIVLGD